MKGKNNNQKSKSKDPVVESVQQLREGISKMLEPVDSVITQFNNNKTNNIIDKETADRLEPMIKTLSRDRKVFDKKAQKVYDSVSNIKNSATVENHHKLHVAGTQMFSTMNKIETTSLPMVADVIEIMSEGVSK